MCLTNGDHDDADSDAAAAGEPRGVSPGQARYDGTGDRCDLMDWTRDATGRQDMLIPAIDHGLVWRASTGEWIALLSDTGQAVYHMRCGRRKEAQAQMEARLRELLQERQHTEECRD